MALLPVSTRPSKDPYRKDTCIEERLDSAPFIAWYDEIVERRRHLAQTRGGGAGGQDKSPMQPVVSVDHALVFHGTNSRRISAARCEGRVTMNTVLAALTALDAFTDAWELAWNADQAVRELVPFRDARGRDLLEPAIAAVEKWHAWT